MTTRKKAEAPPAKAPDQVAGSAIVPVPFGRLRRAPENVRKTDVAADVESLADDIAAHGLLQSLIGYQGKGVIVCVAGGGRRLQALELLRKRGAIDDDFPVSVLIRPQAEAIELSLSENLARRDMNPADEFSAFAALLRGTTTPAELAKRFGFTERYVKQRLRLSVLADDILDALRAGKMTLDAAMAYARSQDQAIQMKIFKAQIKAWRPHDPDQIRIAFMGVQMTTGDPLFRFVTAKDYEAKGGQYEDDLFSAASSPSEYKKVRDAGIVTAIAADRAAFQLDRIKSEAKEKHPTTVDVLLAPGIRRGKTPKIPPGCKIIDRGWNCDLTWAQLWARAVKVGALITGIASVDSAGKLSLEERFFVPADKVSAVMPPPRGYGQQKSEEERAAERRADAVKSIAAVLAAEELSKAKTEGRRFYNSSRPQLWNTETVEGLGECWAVPQTYYVTTAELDAKLAEAEIEFDRQEAAEVAAREARETERAEAEAALEKQRAEVLAMDPAPVVVILDAQPWYRWADGQYFDEPEDVDAEPFEGGSLAELLDQAVQITAAFATIGEYFAFRDANPQPGTCRICGCTEDHACETDDGTCSWADDSETLCDNPDCVAKAAASSEAAGEVDIAA